MCALPLFSNYFSDFPQVPPFPAAQTFLDVFTQSL